MLVHRAHRLLSESTLILCTLSEQAPSKANARRLHRNWSIPEPIVISDQNGYSTLSEFRREPHFQVQTCTLEVSCWCARCRAYWQVLGRILSSEERCCGVPMDV